MKTLTKSYSMELVSSQFHKLIRFVNAHLGCSFRLILQILRKIQTTRLFIALLMITNSRGFGIYLTDIFQCCQGFGLCVRLTFRLIRICLLPCRYIIITASTGLRHIGRCMELRYILQSRGAMKAAMRGALMESRGVEWLPCQVLAHKIRLKASDYLCEDTRR